MNHFLFNHLTSSAQYAATGKAWEVAKLIHNFCKKKQENKEAFRGTPVEHLEIEAVKVPSGITITLHGIQEQDIENIFNMFASVKMNSLAFKVFKEATKVC